MIFALLTLLLSPGVYAFGEGPDVQEIVRRLVQNNEMNWKMAPEYSFMERDVHKGRGKMARHEFKVLMIDGSPYHELIAIGGHPLMPKRAAAEQKKLEAETARRNHESPSDRRTRIAAYEREREQEHALMREMVNAFTFKMAGREQMNGRDCYVLDASPRPGYKPTSNETKVLTGMRGKMWIDTRDFQWVRVQASVFRPVRVALDIADVRPGTEFLLEQKPNDANVWLPSHFLTRVHATALLVWSKSYSEDETYFDYRKSG